MTSEYSIFSKFLLVFRPTVLAAVDQEKENTVGAVARRWRHTTTARMVLSHRSPLPRPVWAMGLRIKPNPFHFEAHGKLCRKINTAKANVFVEEKRPKGMWH